MYVVTVDHDICSGCGECSGVCPAQMFELENSKAVVQNNECLGCMSCVAVCPKEAITVQEY